MVDINKKCIFFLNCLIICFMPKTESLFETFNESESLPGLEKAVCPSGNIFGLSSPDKRDIVLNTTVVNASFGTHYNCSVDVKSQILFIYTYNETVNVTTAVRVSVNTRTPEVNYPLMVVIRQQEGLLSWMVPLYIDSSYPYNLVSRTLCPMDRKQRTKMTSQQMIYVELSTMNRNKTWFDFQADKLVDFELGHEERRNVSVTPSQPQYLMYTFPDDVTSVHLKVTSPSQTCMVVSIQDTRCPVFDLDRNVGYSGKHQTMATQAAMFLERSDYTSGSLYVVFIVKKQDYSCAGIETIRQSADKREKNVTVYLQTALSKYQYYKAIFSALGLFLAFYLAAAVIGCVYHCCGWSKDLTQLTASERDKLLPFQPNHLEASQVSSNQTVSDENRAFSEYMPHSRYGAVESLNSDTQRQLSSVSTTSSHDTAIVTAALDDTSDIDFLPDAEQEKHIIRTKTAMFVTDLARKSAKKLDKMYKIYHWNLLTIAIFYGLPVAQLVITYQKVLKSTGNDDLCYYNFDCANPLGVLSSFNNVFSNIGYILLGLLFIFLVWRRDLIHKQLVASNDQLEKLLGIPQHFGLFYAMGLALVMEGIMSACYHVCPNYSNFQFDTSFMYIIACLNILKIYQTRHPDINAKAYQTYFFMAIVIFIAVVGVVYAASFVWILYGIIHMFASLILTGQVYYMGTWKMDRHIFRRIFHVFLTDGIRCAKPTYTSRFILLFIGNVINWSFALYGAIEQPGDFATYLLAIFIGNLLLYSLFYILMKLLSGERLCALPLACILFATVTWGAALFFFFSHLTSWAKTPAGSREGNRDCILLQFYDDHDIWHFLSAIGLFFSFLILLTLDDDLAFTRRDRIPVF